MALVTSIGFPGTTSQGRLYTLKEFLKTVGWTVTSSGDGFSLFSASGDVITSGNAATGGLGQTRAWFAIRSPDGVNAFTFQHTGSDLNRVKWSPGGTFTGGNVTTTPTASGGVEGLIRGGGTDASPTGATLVSAASSGTSKLVMAATNTAPHVFWMVSHRTPGNREYFGGVLMLDSVSALPGDAHPYVWSSEGNNTGFDPTSINTPGSTNYTGFWSPSAVPTTLVNGRAAFYCKYFTGTNQDTIVRIPYQDLITGKDILFPIAWGAFNAPPGTTPGTWKGVSNSCYWSGGSVVGTADIRGRQAGDTGSITSTRDTLYFPPFAFQWDGSDPAALLIP